jgi:hypothetical protein
VGGVEGSSWKILGHQGYACARDIGASASSSSLTSSHPKQEGNSFPRCHPHYELPYQRPRSNKPTSHGLKPPKPKQTFPFYKLVISDILLQ